MEIKQISKEEAQKSMGKYKYSEAYEAVLECKDGLEITFDDRQSAVNFRFGLKQKKKRNKDFPNFKASVTKNKITIIILDK